MISSEPSSHIRSLGNGELDELALIDEFLVENTRELRLPGPPPPPPDTDVQHHTSGPTGSPSGPVLVPRGTAPQRPRILPPASNTGPRVMASAARGSKGSAQRRSAAAAPRNTRLSNTGTEQLERLLDKPQLVVVEQPKERGMRFRYECEGRSAGSILGASSTEVNKTLPAIELRGPIAGIKHVKVTVSLVTKDIPYRPHPHCLVGKDCSDGICVVSFNPHTTRRHSFVNLGIQCVRRKELDASLKRRRNKNIDPFNTGHTKSIEDMDMNVVRLCFQCELERDDGDRIHLAPEVSNPIYDKKATTTAELKINRLNVVRGPCTGKTEIYMLCDKVQKDDIEIIFSLGNWEAKAEFAQTDVHRQIAIVFKSPAYQEQDIVEEVEVNVSLRRMSDRMYSEPVKFTYLPCNTDPYEVNRKRKIKSDVKFNEECCAMPALDITMQEPSLPQQYDPFSYATSDFPGPSASFSQDESPSVFPQVPDEIHYPDDDHRQEDSCVSLDPDTMNNILSSLKECFGAQGFLQLFNNPDPNSNFVSDSADANLNPPDRQAQMQFSDPQYNQMVSTGQQFIPDHEVLPPDLQAIYSARIKNENDEES